MRILKLFLVQPSFAAAGATVAYAAQFDHPYTLALGAGAALCLMAAVLLPDD